MSYSRWPGTATATWCRTLTAKGPRTFASVATTPERLGNGPPAIPRNASDPLDDFIVATARSLEPTSQTASALYTRFQQTSGVALDYSIPYEAYPSAGRRADVLPASSDQLVGDGLVLVVHAVLPGDGTAPDFTVCSGFVVNSEDAEPKGQHTVVTCAHTLVEIEQRHPGKPTTSFVISPNGSGGSSLVLPISDISASLPRSDVLVCTVPALPTPVSLRSLPLSPFPMYRGQPLLMHFFGSPDPPEPAISPVVAARSRTSSSPRGKPRAQHEPIPWPVDGLGWRRWVSGEMLGYRNSQWQEVEPGTSSALRFMMASPLPTPGSSGGPILDAEHGTVVGMISGRRMDNRVEGERGWGVTAERIFDMFAIPGFVPASKRRR